MSEAPNLSLQKGSQKEETMEEQNQEPLYKVIKEHTWIDPNELKRGSPYQRGLEESRLKKIKGKMKKYGYKPHEVVAINQNNGIVDGQHRANIACQLGIKQIPVTIYEFDSIENEAMFFADCNDHVTNLNSITYWYSKYMYGDKLATYIHWLEKDQQSMLNDNIKVKGKQGGNKLTIPEVLSLMTAAFNIPNSAWTRDDDYRFQKVVEKYSYDGENGFRENMNNVVDFFYKCFGKVRYENRQAFKQGTIRPFTIFYKRLKERGLDNDQSASKMSSFVFTNEFHKLTFMGKVISFTDYFNRNRTKNRIPYPRM